MKIFRNEDSEQVLSLSGESDQSFKNENMADQKMADKKMADLNMVDEKMADFPEIAFIGTGSAVPNNFRYGSVHTNSLYFYSMFLIISGI